MVLTKLICSAHWQRSISGCHEIVGFLMVTFSTNHAKRQRGLTGKGKAVGKSATVLNL